MPLGISDDHQALAESVREWGHGLGVSGLIHAAETDPAAGFTDVWSELAKQGIASIAVPERVGGGGGDVLDLAVALEATAAELVPGPILGTAVASAVLAELGDLPGVAEVLASIGAGAAVGLAPEASFAIGERVTGTGWVYDAPLVGTTAWVLAAARDADGAEHWAVFPAALATVDPQVGLDLSRRTARLSVDVAVGAEGIVPLPGLSSQRVRDLIVVLAAAEAAGIAGWCLATAVDYAKVREQFGQPIGKFQALKHLMAEMAEDVEAITASAWDAAAATVAGDPVQARFATTVAAAHAFDRAVHVAQAAIQVLGGIGFTFEHDAHLYLRRATALRALTGSSGAAALDLARQSVAGTRRQLQVDLEGADAIRAEIRATAATIAAAEDQRRALVETGYLMPHWSAPYGLGASPLQQLVIDEELAAAGVTRPDLKIGGWAVPTVLAHGSDAQREQFVTPTLVGDLQWCQLFSEPGAGSDLASLATKADRVEGGWKLTGQKVWTSLAAQADWGICLARTNPDVPKHKGISYFLVDMTSAGLDIRPLREMTGDALFNEVFLDGVFVPDEYVVGEIDGGWALARTTLSNERVAMASAKLGASVERAVEVAAGASAMSEGDLIQVGQAVALATTCAQLGARVTRRSLAGRGPGAESSVSKLLGVRSRQDASELVVELQGYDLLADPAVLEADVHEMLLTRCLSIAGGTTQVLRNVVAEQILGLPR